MNTKEFIYTEHARASIFNIFSALLCQPENDLIVSTELFDNLKYALKIVNPKCVEHAEKMQDTIKKYTAQELLIEYAKLFIGPFKVIAPPYSSLYFGNKEQLMSDKTIWVMNFYRKSGLEFDHEKIKDLPDHVVVETEFMYYLIFNEINTLDGGDKKKSHTFWENQMKFYNKHYKKWVLKFCKKISEGTNNEYYKVLSECLSKYITTVSVPPFPTEK